MDGDDVISLIFASFVRIQKYFLMFIFSKHFTQDLSTTLRAPYGADRQPRLRYRQEPTEGVHTVSIIARVAITSSFSRAQHKFSVYTWI